MMLWRRCSGDSGEMRSRACMRAVLVAYSGVVFSSPSPIASRAMWARASLEVAM